MVKLVIMVSTSNLYAEKIFSEHPIQLWSLDEKADFVSYLNDSEKVISDVSKWSKLGGTATLYDNSSSIYNIPISEPTYKLTNSSTTLLLTSTSKTISGSTVSFYFYPTSNLLTSIEIQVGSETTQIQSVTSDMLNTWVFVSKTFSNTSSGSNALKIAFIYSASTANDTYINGLSWGYDSENFNGVSTGITPISLPSTISYGSEYAWSGTAHASTSTKTFQGVTRTNLVSNPSFETNATLWQSGQTANVTRSTTYSYKGSASGLTTITSASDTNIGYFTGALNVISGKTYTYSAYFYVPAGSPFIGRSIGLPLEGGTATATVISSNSETLVAGVWTRSSVILTATSSGILQFVHRYSGAIIANGSTIYTDAVLFEQSSTLNSYFDGSFSKTMSGISTYCYGKEVSLSNTGYYITDSSKLFAKNTSIPMVYGAGNTTILSPNYDNTLLETYPSLVVPGQGFLNNSSKNKDLTFEAWIKINIASTTSKRIFGPIGSTDGLYVEGPFFRLKVGNASGSKYVGEWGRPMLIQIYTGFNIVKMFLNGEEIISFNVDTNNTIFATETVLGKDNTFLAFYSYSDMYNIEIDSIAIYPYQINATVAMKRWVYGQAVEFNQHLNYSYGGKTAMIDYPFADYSNNYNFPKNEKWNSAITENINTENDVLSSPNYNLPDYYVSNTLTDLSSIPTYSSDSFGNYFNVASNSNLLFSSLNQLNSETKSIYGIFKRIELSSVKQTLFYIINEITQEYFKVSINGSTLYYDIKTNNLGIETNVATITSAPEIFAVGLHIDKLINNSPFNISSFFTNKERLKVYVAGSSIEDSFSGNIYKIGFASKYDVSFMNAYFNSDGTVIAILDADTVYDALNYNTTSWTLTADAGTNSTTVWDSLISGETFPNIYDYNASYELVPISYFDSLKLDIKTKSYWQESVPLTRLSKYVKDASGNNIYDIDYLQLNIDYPEPAAPLTGYIDTSSSLVKTYVTFQSLLDGANKDINSFDVLGIVNNEAVSVADSGWKITKYEVVNGSIVYVPKTFDTGESIDNYAVTLHIEIINPGILTNPVKIRSLDISSKALNYVTENPIGTKYGSKLVPYNESTGTKNYKSKNPIRIYKGSSPHLYLTKHSGIKLSGDTSFGNARGYLLDISTISSSNTNDVLNDSLGFIQIAMRWNYESLPTAETEIFRIVSQDGIFQFYITASSTAISKAVITAKLNGVAYSPTYYWNGNIVKNPMLKINEWGMLGIAFPSPIILNNSSSSINITSNLLINNISYYVLNDIQLAQKQYKEKSWSLLSGSWNGITTSTWKDIYLSISKTPPLINPSETYKSYTGSNKIISLGEGEPNKFALNGYQYSTYFGLYKKTNNVDVA